MINTRSSPLCEDNNSVVIELQWTIAEKKLELCLIVLCQGQRGVRDWLLRPEAPGLSGLQGVTPRWLEEGGRLTIKCCHCTANHSRDSGHQPPVAPLLCTAKQVPISQ